VSELVNGRSIFCRAKIGGRELALPAIESVLLSRNVARLII